MKSLFPGFPGGRIGAALLILRVVVGVGMMMHGWGKIQNPFHWSDKAANPPPQFLQALAALSEFGGGAAIALGLLTPLAALGVICTMLYAILLVHVAAGDDWIASGPGKRSYELAGLYLAGAVTLLLTGPGLFSLDAMLFGSRGRRPR